MFLLFNEINKLRQLFNSLYHIKGLLQRMILKRRLLSFLILLALPVEKKFEKISFFISEQKFSKFLAYNTPQPPLSVHKNSSSIGPAVWPCIGNL